MSIYPVKLVTTEYSLMSEMCNTGIELVNVLTTENWAIFSGDIETLVEKCNKVPFQALFG